MVNQLLVCLCAYRFILCITQYVAAFCLICNGVVEGYEWFQQLGRVKDSGLYC